MHPTFLFETPNLQIRPLTHEDFDPFFEMQSNPNVLRYTSGEVQSLETCQADLKKIIHHYQEPDNGFWIWAILRTSDNAFVGTAAIIVNKNQVGEIGYRFLEKYWGNGFGSEVMTGLVKYGFQEMKLKSLFAVADVLNVGSIKILERSDLNFIKEEWNEEEESRDRFYKLKNPFL